MKDRNSFTYLNNPLFQVYRLLLSLADKFEHDTSSNVPGDNEELGFPDEAPQLGDESGSPQISEETDEI